MLVSYQEKGTRLSHKIFIFHKNFDRHRFYFDFAILAKLFLDEDGELSIAKASKWETTLLTEHH